MTGALPFFLFVWLFGRRKDLTRRAQPVVLHLTPQHGVPIVHRSKPPTHRRPATRPHKPPKVVHRAPKRRTPKPRHHQARPVPRPVVHTPSPVKAPVPWPQVVPPGLPPFPGAGWEPDSPPGAGVSARAVQLLPQLWSHGVGTHKTEHTAGRWITYVARQMGPRRGVVAYRLRKTHRAPTPVVHREPTPPPPRRSRPRTPPPAPAPHKSPVALPTLRRGSRGPDVVLAQQKLGGITADGIFGPKTEARVRSYQTSHGLQVDGVIGPQTWGSLFSSGGANA